MLYRFVSMRNEVKMVMNTASRNTLKDLAILMNILTGVKKVVRTAPRAVKAVHHFDGSVTVWRGLKLRN